MVKFLVVTSVVPQGWMSNLYKVSKFFAPDLLFLIYLFPFDVLRKNVTRKRLFFLSVVFWSVIAVFMVVSDFWRNQPFLNLLPYAVCFFGVYYLQSKGTDLMESLVVSGWCVTLLSYLWELPFSLVRGEFANFWRYAVTTYGFGLMWLLLLLRTQDWCRKKLFYSLTTLLGYLLLAIVVFVTPHFHNIYIGNFIRLGTLLAVITRFVVASFLIVITVKVE